MVEEQTSTAASSAPETPPAGKAPTKKAKKKATVAKNSYLKIDNILLPKDWNRAKLGDLSHLIASIKEEGQMTPIVVRPTEKAGQYMLVDGHRRLAAMRKAGFTMIMVTFSKARTDSKAFLQSMVANLAREDNSAYEIATSFGKLVSEFNMTNEKIAKACGKTAGYVSQYLAVLKTPEVLQKALEDEKIPIAIFRHFARLDQEEDATFYDKMVDAALNGTSAQDVGDNIENFLQKKEEKAAKAAAKAGKKPAPKAPKKGAAAHKSKKNAPTLQIPDYRSSGVSKGIKMISKKDALDWLDTYRDKALSATTSRKREYYQGVLEGLELATGLLKEG